MAEQSVERARGERRSAAPVPGLADLVSRNETLAASPTARAERVYTGVLYDALGLPGLPGDARRRASSRIAVVSSLFGLVRPADRIPAYRLSGDTSLPWLMQHALGIQRLRFASMVWGGGGSGACGSLAHAVAAVESGQAANVLVFRSIVQRPGSR